MSRILMIGGNPDLLRDFTKVLRSKNSNSVSWDISGEDALENIEKQNIDTVVVDEKLPRCDGFSFVRKLMRMYPMVNCAVMSPLPADDFHEATEGLGVFMQLPTHPGAAHAERMLELIETIDVMMNL